jgi:lambda family phage minor tail protein L
MSFTAWAATTAFVVGDVRRATTLQTSGLVFRCTVAGTSASTEPAWPTDIGSTVTDGTATWQAISSVYEELAALAPNAIIELFQLKLVAALHGSSDTYYFHAGANAAVTGNIVWNGQTYIRLPIQAEGFEYGNTGTLPRPTLSVANLGGEISALLLIANAFTPGNDLGGATVTRIRTLKKFLDGEAAADPHAKFPDEIWYIDRKSAETRDVVQWELASKFDLAGMVIPKRQIIANICQWQYRSAECGYAGAPVAGANDQRLTSSSNATLQAYYDALATYQDANATTRAAAATLATATNALSYAQGNYTLQENRYNSSTDYVRYTKKTGATIAEWSNAAVSLGATYRRGDLVSSSGLYENYRIQRWATNAAAISAAQSTYNTALSAYNSAVSAEATAKTAYETARDAYLALVPSGASPDDVCGKKLSSCKLRFYGPLGDATSELPFGSFPGAGLTQ